MTNLALKKRRKIWDNPFNWLLGIFFFLLLTYFFLPFLRGWGYQNQLNKDWFVINKISIKLVSSLEEVKNYSQLQASRPQVESLEKALVSIRERLLTLKSPPSEGKSHLLADESTLFLLNFLSLLEEATYSLADTDLALLEREAGRAKRALEKYKDEAKWAEVEIPPKLFFFPERLQNLFSGQQGFGSPLEAVQWELGLEAKLKAERRKGTRSWVLAESKDSQKKSSFALEKGSDGLWRIVKRNALSWDGDFPRPLEPFSEKSYLSVELGREFPTAGNPPDPTRSGLPPNGYAASAWKNVDKLLNALKAKRVDEATLFVTEDFYKRFFYNLFSTERYISLQRFKLRGYDVLGDKEVRVWARLFFDDGINRYQQDIAFQTEARSSNSIVVDAIVYQPRP